MKTLRKETFSSFISNVPCWIWWEDLVPYIVEDIMADVIFSLQNRKLWLREAKELKMEIALGC